MSFQTIPLTGSKPAQYAQLLAQGAPSLHGERDRIANAANLSALVYQALPDLNWVGFYFYDGTELVVGPFQGLPACVRIPLDKGVWMPPRTRQTNGSRMCTPSPGTSPAIRPATRAGSAAGRCRRRPAGRVRPRQSAARAFRR